MVRIFRGFLHGGKKVLTMRRSKKAKQVIVYFTCRNVGRSGYQLKKEKKKICRPLAAERAAAVIFVLFLSLVQGSSERR